MKYLITFNNVNDRLTFVNDLIENAIDDIDTIEFVDSRVICVKMKSMNDDDFMRRFDDIVDCSIVHVRNHY